MAADTNDLVKKVGIGTATTLSAPGKAMAAASITVGSTANFPSTTGIIVAIRVVDSNGEMVAGTYTEWSATVSSGTTLALVTTPVYGTDQVYTAGSTTQVYMPLSSYGYNKFADAFIAEHSQLDGTHAVELITSRTEDTNPDPDADFVLTYDTSATALKKVKLENLSGSGSGWIPNVLPAPDTVTNNGNRSYDLVFNSTDLTDTVSEGMRLRTTRTVSAPTQCTDLESGSSQYWSRASGSLTGSVTTKTDDLTASAWIKLESYVDGGIVSRYNGTSGWIFRIKSDGTLRFGGYNAGAANNFQMDTYQSLPLNKWVHVAGSLDMSGGTTTTNKIMIDGVDVPVTVARAGTNPVAWANAGNLEVGSYNGANFFDGKIKQVWLGDGNVSTITQATVRSYSSQTITGAETNCFFAATFNGNGNDSNASANNLTANGGAVATNVDSPFGNYLGGTLDDAIITKKAFSTNTTLTVQVPEGCTIPTSGGVSAVAYSTQAVPYGFPRSSDRWSILMMNKTNSTQASPVASTVYNLGNEYLTIPVGSWNVEYSVLARIVNATNQNDVNVTLSTGNNSTSDIYWTTRGLIATGATGLQTQLSRSGFVTVTSATPYYLNTYTTVASANPMDNRGDISPTLITAIPAYL